MLRHQIVLTKKREALKECQRWGLLTNPRTVWEAHKLVREEINLREIMYDLADSQITNEQLYADLNITKNS